MASKLLLHDDSSDGFEVCELVVDESDVGGVERAAASKAVAVM